MIPVTCVEQGAGATGAATPPTSRAPVARSSPRARARKAAGVTESLRSRGERAAPTSRRSGPTSPTRSPSCGAASETLAMADAYESRAAQVEAYVNAFRAAPRQHGAVVTIDGQPVGLELFDSAAAFSRYLAKLVRSYALDAIETADGLISASGLAPSEAQVRRFLDRVSAAAGERFPALGEGEDIRLTGSAVAGGALAVDGRLVHLAGFAVGVRSASLRAEASRFRTDPNFMDCILTPHARVRMQRRGHPRRNARCAPRLRRGDPRRRRPGSRVFRQAGTRTACQNRARKRRAGGPALQELRGAELGRDRDHGRSPLPSHPARALNS